MTNLLTNVLSSRLNVMWDDQEIESLSKELLQMVRPEKMNLFEERLAQYSNLIQDKTIQVL